MVINAVQTDALTEAMNIGLGRAAASLSELTRQRILLEVPALRLVSIGDLQKAFEIMRGPCAVVHQRFQGGVDGHALFVLEDGPACRLVKLLTQDTCQVSLDISSQEVLAEVGNQLLHASVGTLGDIIESRVVLSVPSTYVDRFKSLLEVVLNFKPEDFALMITTQFRLQDDSVSGHIVIVLSVGSLQQILRAFE